MAQRFTMFLMLSILFAMMPTMHHLSNAAPAVQVTTTKDLVPLPKGCGGGLPPGNGSTVCCVSGYVFLDGKPIAGAEVSISNQRTGGRVIIWTEYGPDSDQPYFRTSLHAMPLNTQPGDTIRIRADVSARVQSVDYVVRAGGQQIDIVMPHSMSNDYIYQRQFMAQTPEGTFALAASGIAIDGAGVVYVTDTDNHRIQAFNLQGQFIRSWGSAGLADGEFLNPVGITVDRDGTVYVADHGQNTIEAFTSTGEWLRYWGVGLVTDVDVDAQGNIYATMIANGSSGVTQLRKYSPTGALLGEWGYTGNGPQQLNDPWGLSIGTDGNVYVADTYNNRIMRFSPNIESFTQIAASEIFALPFRIHIAADGTILVANTDNHQLKILSASGSLIKIVGSQGSGELQFEYSQGLAVDSTGNIYIVDSGNQRIQVFNPESGFLRQWGSQGENNQKLLGPEKIITDAANNVYISDARRNEIKVFNPDGQFIRRIPNVQPVKPEDRLEEPLGMALDSVGNLYVADMLHHRIQVFNPDGTPQRMFGSYGTGDGEFNLPIDVAIYQNNLYVVERANHRLQKFTLQGVHQWTLGGPQAGTTNGQFDRPRGIGLDNTGNIYVADTWNSRIQVVDPLGNVVRSWQMPIVSGGDTSLPTDVAIHNGVVFVADFNNHRFLRFDTQGNVLSSYGRAGSVGILGNPGSSTGIAVDLLGRVYVASRLRQRVQLFAAPAYTKPIATIVSIDKPVAQAGDTITLRGLGAPSLLNAAAVSYEWTLDGAATPFATTADAQLSTNGLTPGNHTVTLWVRSGAEVSEPRSTTMMVLGVNAAEDQPKTWTLMLYLAGDNADITSYMNDSSNLGTLYRLSQTSLPSNVSVIALFDGDTNNDSVLWLFRAGQPPQATPLSERNMDRPQTLIDFVREAQKRAPADAYYLSIANHGNALDGIAWDRSSAINNSSERLTNPDLRQALIEITENGKRPIDVLHLDACLMGLVESAYLIGNNAKYLIVSQNQAWSAFAYDKYSLLARSNPTPEAFAMAIVDSYASRVELDHNPYTISALNLAKMDTIQNRIDSLANSMLIAAQSGPDARAELLAIRAQAQKFDSSGNGLITDDDEYVDLDHLVRLLELTSTNSAIRTAASNLRGTINELVLHERHASGTYNGAEMKLDNARGVSIFYPKRSGMRTYQTYRNEMPFASDTQWDEFLQAQLSALPGNIEAIPDPNPVAPLPLAAQKVEISLPLVVR